MRRYVAVIEVGDELEAEGFELDAAAVETALHHRFPYARMSQLTVRFRDDPPSVLTAALLKNRGNWHLLDPDFRGLPGSPSSARTVCGLTVEQVIRHTSAADYHHFSKRCGNCERMREDAELRARRRLT